MNKFSALIILIILAVSSSAQTSPLLDTSIYTSDNLKSFPPLSDTIDFSPYPAGTVITTQYLDQGVIFSGHDGSGAPIVYEYVSPYDYGRILRSDTWFSALKLQFVDTINTSQYQLAKRIEFDNVVEYNGEIDYIKINVYDSDDVVIYTYLSQSPEHVILDFGSPVAAYITIADSAATSYALDNFIIDFGLATHINQQTKADINIFPNPSEGPINIISSQIIEELSIFNSMGQRVYHVFPRQSNVQFELNTLGIYYAIITSEGLSNMHKILVSP